MVMISLDTSCINSKGKNASLNELEDMGRRGLISIVSSTSVEEELLEPEMEPYRSNRLSKFRTYDVDTSNWVLGFSRLGISTKLGGESTAQEMESIAAILFPTITWKCLNQNQIRDVMALHTHWSHGREIFVTLNTNDFIGRAKRMDKQEQLKSQLGINVMTPDQSLEYVKLHLGD